MCAPCLPPFRSVMPDRYSNFFGDLTVVYSVMALYVAAVSFDSPTYSHFMPFEIIAMPSNKEGNE
ncbi:hypothetical protein DL98DRAFT_30929 [Cadophora sp. DSE1049]|nr:hypothetical protein DL98DRAFT_30929 [Cadophora sp. DSE1049]